MIAVPDANTERAPLEAIARTATLLVVCDYDGTLAPIVDNPDMAHPHPESVAALSDLAALPDTHVAVVSGRSLRDLAALSQLPDEIHLVGSHGSEFDAGFVRNLTDQQVELRETISRAMERAAGHGTGFSVENKPASVAFHYRNAVTEDAEAAVASILDGVARLPGVQLKLGKMVVELAVVHTDKGTAIEQLRHRVGADAVIFMGDDVTDEDAFAVLAGEDLGIKIGPGDTLAHQRLVDTREASRYLALLGEMRQGWLRGQRSPGAAAR